MAVDKGDGYGDVMTFWAGLTDGRSCGRIRYVSG